MNKNLYKFAYSYSRPNLDTLNTKEPVPNNFYNTPITDSISTGAKAGFGIGGAVGTAGALNKAFRKIYNASSTKANPNILMLEGTTSKAPDFINRARFSRKAIKNLKHLPTKALVLSALTGVGLGKGIVGSIGGLGIGAGLGLLNNLRQRLTNPSDGSSKKIDFDTLQENLG